MDRKTKSGAVITVRDLSLALRRRKRLLPIFSDISFQLERGKVTAMVGESGSGKSLLCRSLLKLAPGDAELEGNLQLAAVTADNLLRLPEEAWQKIRGREIGMLFQEPASSLNPVLRCGRQIRDVVRTHRRLTGKEARSAVLELLARVGLDDCDRVYRSYPHELSGGMAQRVALALALAGEPSVCIADEPFTALDAVTRESIIQTVVTIMKEKSQALLIVLHDLELARNYSDRLLVMYAGQIMESGPTDLVFANPLHPYTIALLNIMNGLRSGILPSSIPGEVPSVENLPSGCPFHPRCPRAESICRTRAAPVLHQAHRAVACHFVT